MITDTGIPKFEQHEFSSKNNRYCLCIPIINEGNRIIKELLRAQKNDIDKIIDNSIEDVPRFIEKLEEGFDFIQGSRFISGGQAVNTPLLRYLSIKLIHAPIISLTAKRLFTDTTNAFRGYSKNYLLHPKVKPFREIFSTYELLAYLSTRASQLGLKTCEIPVTRIYPQKGKVPTKISFFHGNRELLKRCFSFFCFCLSGKIFLV